MLNRLKALYWYLYLSAGRYKCCHVRIYGADYKARLQQAGFSVEEFKWIHERRTFGGCANLFALNKKEVVFVACKPLLDIQPFQANISIIDITVPDR